MMKITLKGNGGVLRKPIALRQGRQFGLYIIHICWMSTFLRVGLNIPLDQRGARGLSFWDYENYMNALIKRY